MSHSESIPQVPSYAVNPGENVDLAQFPTSEKGPFAHKKDSYEALRHHRHRIIALQERLWAEHKQSLLIVLQATDTGGKDGTIRHVLRGVNPQGCRVWSFKEPSAEELDHDFLWRVHQRTPARGMMTVFNRSQYEDVLVVRVHDIVPEKVWQTRYDQINNFERMLVQNNTTIVKFFLHISREEQQERLQARLDEPDKHWKFMKSDLNERAFWDNYQEAYADAIARCSTEYAPWYVIPADRKWYRNVAVAQTIADTLEAMDPQFPKPVESLDTIVISD
ncbi:MAG: polyphosphate kinase 2 family protein [Thermomicrobiales bacterium]